MFNTVVVIATNTFRETIRNKILYNILLFAIVTIALSISFGQWSVFARVMVMNDLGLFAMSLSGLLLSIFIGSSMLGKEISGHTIYMMATRPIERSAILIGKFLGVYATLFLNFLLMGVAFAVSLYLAEGTVGISHLQALTLLFVEMGVILSASLLFSVLSSPTLAAIFTLGFYIIGHLNELASIEHVLENSGNLAIVVKLINIILPNLDHFNIRSAVVFGESLPFSVIGLASLYGVLYVAIMLLLSTLAFEKKDL